MSLSDVTVGDTIAMGSRPLRERISEAWLVCDYPERPPDEMAHVHLVNCHACRVAAEVMARLWPDKWKLVYEVQSLYWAER